MNTFQIDLTRHSFVCNFQWIGSCLSPYAIHIHRIYQHMVTVKKNWNINSSQNTHTKKVALESGQGNVNSPVTRSSSKMH